MKESLAKNMEILFDRYPKLMELCNDVSELVSSNVELELNALFFDKLFNVLIDSFWEFYNKSLEELSWNYTSIKLKLCLK